MSTVIPGTKSVAQLESSLLAVEESLPAESFAAIRSWYEARLGAKPLDW